MTKQGVACSQYPLYSAFFLTEITMEKANRPVMIGKLAVISLWLLACQGPSLRPAPMLTVEPTSSHNLPIPPNSPIPASVSTTSVPHIIPSQACQLADLPIVSEMLWQLDRFAWSPTGDALAYLGPNESDDSFMAPLMLVADSLNSTSRLLAPSAVGDPTWSPNGSQIAFVTFRPEDQLGTIMVVNTDGSGLLDLLPEDTARTDPGTGYKAIEGWWDEGYLVVTTDCGTGCRRLMVLNLQARTLEPVFPSGLEGGSYAYSPDHALIVVMSGANPQIGVVLHDEREILWLSGHGSLDQTWASFWTFFADWSPDSSRFLFLRQPSDGSAPPELWVWDKETRRVSALLSGVIAARWSPRGDQIAFVTLGQPHWGPDGEWQGIVVAPQGPNMLGVGLYQWPTGKVVAFFESGEVSFGYRYPAESLQSLAPVWSPDGRHLAYYDGAGQVWILSVDELSQYQVPTRGRPVDEARWSPDGKRLAIRVSDSLQIFAIPCSP